MAVLSTTDRKRIWRGLMRYWSKSNTAIALDKAELRAAIDATDTWQTDNQASYTSALPAAAQANLTAVQKTFLFCVVALMRVGVDLLKTVLGGVD